MAKRLQNAWLLILALLCQQPGSSVAEERLHFQQNAIDVSTTQYGGFLVDRDGFVWIGTTGYAALRHDGYELKSFASSIPGAMISSIVEDRDGDIWFSSFSRGITRYDKAKGEFTSYQHDPKDANSLNSNTISFSPQKLCVDKSNRLWIGTDEAGLCEFDKTTGTFRRHQHDPHDSNSLNDNAVVSVAEGSDNTIWVGTQSGGLNKYDRRTGKWKHYKHDPDDMRSLSHNWVNSILEDREGVLWVGTKKGGLNKLNKETSTFTRYMHDPDDPQSIGGDEVWSMHEDHWGLIWVCHIASPTSGLERFDKKRGSSNDILTIRTTHPPLAPIPSRESTSITRHRRCGLSITTEASTDTTPTRRYSNTCLAIQLFPTASVINPSCQLSKIETGPFGWELSRVASIESILGAAKFPITSRREMTPPVYLDRA